MPPPFFQATIAKSPQSNCRRHKTTLRKQVSRKRISLCRSQQQKMCALDSRCSGLVGHRHLVRRVIARITRLDPSVGRSGPRAFAVRVSAPRQRALSASIASCSNVRDDRDTPLVGQDAQLKATDLPDGASGFFEPDGVTIAIVLTSL